MNIRDIFELARRAQEVKPGSPPDQSIENTAIFLGLGLVIALGVMAVILLWGNSEQDDKKGKRE